MAIFDQWRTYRKRKNTQRQQEAALSGWIERMVQESGPEIRQVADYRRRLQGPVESAVAYFEGLIAAIPGPFDLSAGLWDKDPLMHALFVGPDEIRSLLQKCTALKSHFLESGDDSAVAVMSAARNERTVFGTALKGETIQRDVAQTAVEFHDHRVVAPVATEAESRRLMIQRGLNLLAAATLEKTTEAQALKEELAAQRRILAAKLRILETREGGFERLMTDGGRDDERAGEARQLLKELDGRLGELKPESGTPRGALNELERVLTDAGNFLRGSTVRMRLNWMGVKLDPGAPDDGREITLTELEIPERLKRVVMLTRIQAGECLAGEREA